MSCFMPQLWFLLVLNIVDSFTHTKSSAFRTSTSPSITNNISLNLSANQPTWICFPVTFYGLGSHGIHHHVSPAFAELIFVGSHFPSILDKQIKVYNIFDYISLKKSTIHVARWMFPKIWVPQNGW